MSNLYPIPFGYRPLSEAERRALDFFASHDWEAQLRGLLIGGQLQAWSADEYGAVSELPPEFWSSKHYAIALRHEAIHLGISSNKKSSGRPVFLETDLLKILPTVYELTKKRQAERKAAMVEKQAQSSRPHKGGSPAKPGIDDFWVEACRLIYTGEQGGIGQTQAAFVEAMVGWSEQNQSSDPYGLDAVQKKMKKLWKGLGLGKNR